MAEGGQDKSSGLSDVMPTSLSHEISRSATLAEGEHVNQRFMNSSINLVAGDYTHMTNFVANMTSSKEEANPTIQGSATLAEGENVNLRITKSSVNAVAGDQINKKVVYNITGSEAEAPSRSQGDDETRKHGWRKKIRRNIKHIFKQPKASLGTDQTGSATLAEGKNVDQTFMNSSVTVVAGDHIVGNNAVNIFVNAEREAKSANPDESYRKLIQVCNENTKELTTIDILEDFCHEELQQPEFEVYPQMLQIDVRDYYKGRYGHNQLTEEVGFLRKDKMKSKKIGIGDMMASIWKREKSSSQTVGVTAIVASAGSGKSTLTRRIARQALSVSSGKDLTSYSQKMVHYIELKDIGEQGQIKPSKFLFGGLYVSEFQEDQAFEWLDQHQTEAIIIVDGLDQARWHFEEKNLRKIKKYERASCWTVMYNILSRNILRHVKIYMASREFKVSELPPMARPETIITLNGLNLEDAHRLFAFLLKEEGEALWQRIETMSPRLLSLVSVPVFLILTAVAMGRDPSKPPPTTVTELYNRIISSMQSVENIRNRAQIFSIVNKLKALAFQGMREGRVVFKDIDLERFCLSTYEVQDLMTKVPGNNLLSRHLMQGDFTFFFCHQSIQEYLAAIFVTEMEINDFARFDEGHLHGERWSVVRQFVAGVIFLKSQNDLYRVSDGTEKQQVLARSIRLQLERKTGTEGRRTRMELYTAIYESDDDDLMRGLDVIDASEISLSHDEAHILGSLAARTRGLDSLNLEDCSIDDELLGILARCMENRIHVRKVDLRVNRSSATALCSLLGHRRIESLYGKLDWEVVWLDVAGLGFELKNEEDVIKISGDVEGHFNIEESGLVIRRTPSLAPAVFCWELLDAAFVKFGYQRHLYAKQDHLQHFLVCKGEKISKILLDCTEEDNINWSLIETSLKMYQVELLDIAINGQISIDDYMRNLERRMAISGFGSIHSIFVVGDAKDFRKIVGSCQQKKIEYIRCLFYWGCGASLEEMSSLFNNSNVKKVTLVYWGEDDMLKGDELMRAQKIANDVDSELEVLGLHEEAGDAWEQLDRRYFHREMNRRQKMHKR